MARSWSGSGWVQACCALATLAFSALPPIVGKFGADTSSTSSAGNSFIQNYFIYWLEGARQITGTQPAPNPPIAEAQKSNAGLAPPTGAYYLDSLIRASPGGSSFDTSGSAQAGLTIENISGKELLLAFEYRGVRAISNLGGSSECGLDGLKSINGFTHEADPLQFSRLAPGAKISVSITSCSGITSKEKPKSISINIPLLTVENDKVKQFSAALNEIPISQ